MCLAHGRENNQQIVLIKYKTSLTKLVFQLINQLIIVFHFDHRKNKIFDLLVSWTKSSQHSQAWLIPMIFYCCLILK